MTRDNPATVPPRPCIEPGCDETAGTRWTAYWCPKHDQERRDRISANLDAMDEANREMEADLWNSDR